MNNSMSLSVDEKKRLWIFVAIAFGIPLLMSVPMYFAFKRGIDLDVFVTAQMYYPACGVIVGKLLTRRENEMLPLTGYITILVTTVALMALSFWSICSDLKTIETISDVLMAISSIIVYIVFWACGQEKRENAGVTRKNIRMSFLLVVLFMILYVSGIVFSTYLTGLRDGDMASQFAELTDPFKKPMTWVILISTFISFPFAVSAFFGEEYGWRYYLQPLLQKRFGLIGGVLLLGVVWGIWHFNIDLMGYYSKDPGTSAIASRIITCVALGIFFAYAYMKTQNLWVPIIMHFLFNGFAGVLIGGDMSVMQDQVSTWNDIPIELVSMLVFAIFIFAPIFRKRKEAEPIE